MQRHKENGLLVCDRSQLSPLWAGHIEHQSRWSSWATLAGDRVTRWSDVNCGWATLVILGIDVDGQETDSLGWNLHYKHQK